MKKAKVLLNKCKGNATAGGLMILAAEIILMCILKGDIFLNSVNLLSVIRAFSFTAICALGAYFIIVSGGIDLSIGSVLCLSGLVGGIALSQWGVPIIVAILIAMLVGMLCEAINGVLVTNFGFPPFIATLGMMSVARGVGYGITGGKNISVKGFDTFKFLGQGYILGIPVPVFFMVAVCIIVVFVMSKTVFGRRVFAVGGNAKAARVSGINVKRIKLFAYVICGATAGIAGILTAARLGVAMPSSGTGMEFTAITALLMGGVSLNGGKGNPLAAIIGAAIMGILENALLLLSIDAYWQEAIQGAVVLVAIFLDRMRYRGIEE